MSTYSKRPGFQRELAPTTLTPLGLAEHTVFNTYGEVVSVEESAKSVSIFGGNVTVGSSFETVAKLQGTNPNEVYVSTNLIDSISSSSSSDTQVVTVEGYTIDAGGSLTSVIQDVTLSGQTEVTLSTPLARACCARLKESGVFNTTPAVPAGRVYVYDNTDGVTSGTPDTSTATKVLIDVGESRSEKCSFSVGATNYFILTAFGAGIGVSGGSASRVEFRIETRDVPNGGAWIPLGRLIVLDVDQNDMAVSFNPYLIVPKNHDIRVRAKTNSNTAEVFSEITGHLAKIVT